MSSIAPMLTMDLPLRGGDMYAGHPSGLGWSCRSHTVGNGTGNLRAQCIVRKGRMCGPHDTFKPHCSAYGLT